MLPGQRGMSMMSGATLVEQRATIGGTTYVTRYEYNRNNALTKITYPQGTVVAYQRDATGNIASVALNGETIADGFSYEPFGEFNDNELCRRRSSDNRQQ